MGRVKKNSINYSKMLRGEYMKYLFILTMLSLAGCQSLPQLYQAAEDIADDTAIKIEISKEAVEQKKDLKLMLDYSEKVK